MVDKDGVKETSDDFETIHKIFYSKGYVENAVLQQVGKIITNRFSRASISKIFVLYF